VDTAKIDIIRFFHRVEQGVGKLLSAETAPLMLATVDYLASLYREVNKYQNLLDDYIRGNPERMSPKELHRQAWPIVENRFKAVLHQSIENYHHLSGTGLSSSEPEYIIPAAYHGRIETLLFARSVQLWGLFDTLSDRVELREHEEPGIDELLGLAASYVLLNGGNVFTVDQDEMPDASKVAAIFRY
jgi:hypothetical protein